MPKMLECFRVFIASPGGLEDERKAFRSEISEFNEAHAIPAGKYFQAVGWEDILGGIGRPQSIINDDVKSSDYCLVLLWDRWGTATDREDSKFSSGTEEEYHVALECCERGSMQKMILMFKAVDPLRLTDPGPQLQKVLDFKNAVEDSKEHLHNTFDSLEAFGTQLRRHLASWLRDDNGSVQPAEFGVPPNLGEDDIVLDPAETLVTGSFPGDENVTTGKAWQLANKGRVTEAEVEFSRGIVGQRNPASFLSYGRFLHRVGRLDQANVMFRSALEFAQEQDDERAIADSQAWIANVLMMRGNLAGAEEMHRKALEINERLGRPEDMAISYGNLGKVLTTRGDLAGAEEMLRKALEIDERLGRPEGMAIHYGNLGKVLTTWGDLDGAEEMLRKALEIDERLGRLEGMASNCGNLGIVLATRGDLDGAEEVLRKALEIDERLGRPEGMASNYGNLGIVLAMRGDLDGAVEVHRKALEINEWLGRPEGMASNYGSLGNVLTRRGDLDGAEEMHRKALEIDERLGRPEGIAKHYGNLGIVLKTRGNLAGAEEMLRKALEIDERLGRLEGMASSYGNLGDVLTTRGDLAGAKKMYRKGVATAEKLGSSPLEAQIRAALQDLTER